MDINLFTGRTHQIRAHMAYMGMNVLGDSKYGDNNLNRKLKLKYQLLCSYHLKFGRIEDSDFEYLSYKEINCPMPWFVESFKSRKL
jgi:23S rRNA pseudouridine955/2504/2580 synthase